MKCSVLLFMMAWFLLFLSGCKNVPMPAHENFDFSKLKGVYTIVSCTHYGARAQDCPSNDPNNRFEIRLNGDCSGAWWAEGNKDKNCQVVGEMETNSDLNRCLFYHTNMGPLTWKDNYGDIDTSGDSLDTYTVKDGIFTIMKRAVNSTVPGESYEQWDAQALVRNSDGTVTMTYAGYDSAGEQYKDTYKLVPVIK